MPDLDRLAAELPEVTDRRDPPIPVTVHLPLDDEHHDGVLHGWSRTATDDGALRGLIVVRREYSPGF